MSVSTLSSPTLPPVTTVRWTQTLPHGSLCFELASTDAEALARATHIFRPYLTTEHAAQTPLLGFQVEPQPDESGICVWTLRSASDAADLATAPPQSFATLALALATVEFAAVHAAAEYASVAAHNRVVGLHSALLHRNGRGVVIVGVREAGKSTLSCSLWQAGWSLLSDDYVLLSSETMTAASEQGPPSGASTRHSASPLSVPSQPSAFAMSRRVSLRPTSRALLGDEIWKRVLATPASDRLGDDNEGRLLFHPHEVDGSSRCASVPLHALVVLQRPAAPTAPGEATPLDASQALFALLPHCGLLHRTEIGPAMRVFGPLVGKVPAFDLRRGPLPTMVASLNRVLDTL